MMMKENVMIDSQGMVAAQDAHDSLMDLFANIYATFHPNDLVAADAAARLIEAAPRDKFFKFKNKA